MTFLVIRRAVLHLAKFDPNQSMIGDFQLENRKIANFSIFSATGATPSSDIPEICMVCLHIHLKFGKIWFINQAFLTEKLCIGHFLPKFFGKP